MFIFKVPVGDYLNFFVVGGFCLSQLIATFFPCYYCNEYSVVANDLRNGIFHSSNWITLDNHSRRKVLMMLQSTMISADMKVLGVVKLNLETFLNIVNTAYSLYALFSKLS